MKIMTYGDPHGEWWILGDAVERDEPDLIILLGDMDLDEPLDQKLKKIIPEYIDRIYWIPGNHDYDSEDMHDYLFNNSLSDHNLHGKVVDINGVKIAGLGGVFQQNIWHPQTGIKFKTKQQWLDRYSFNLKNNRWRGGLPRGCRSAIWLDDYNSLSEQEADILITHEAPSTMGIKGFDELDLLADVMGVKAIIHGHHHEEYQNNINIKDKNGQIIKKIFVMGTAKNTAKLLPINTIPKSKAKPKPKPKPKKRKGRGP